MSRDHDLIVVGAGPAGAHLALRMARAGWSVALLDARRFPRAKPCGEFLNPVGLELLEELGLRAPLAAAGARPVRRMELHGHGRRAGGGFAGGAGRFDHGYAVRREVLDELTVRAAGGESGVRLLEGHAVGALLRDPGGRVLGVRANDPAGARLELRAPFTIGADGLRSRVARALGVWEPLRWLDRLALVTRAPCAGLEEHAEVHFVPGGYVAMAPTGPGLATLNLVVDRADVPRGRAALPDFVAARVAAAPGLARRLELPRDPREVHAVGPLAARTRAQVFDGAALVGDAAGSVDPVTGEGMYLAMRGAALLAESLDAALRTGRADAGALRAYDRARRREFGHRRALGLALQRGLRHPRVVAGVLALLAARPALTELLLGLTGTGAAPGSLLRPDRLLPALLRAAPAQG